LDLDKIHFLDSFASEVLLAALLLRSKQPPKSTEQNQENERIPNLEKKNRQSDGQTDRQTDQQLARYKTDTYGLTDLP